jgi:hypothetical protein
MKLFLFLLSMFMLVDIIKADSKTTLNQILEAENKYKPVYIQEISNYDKKAILNKEVIVAQKELSFTNDKIVKIKNKIQK